MPKNPELKFIDLFAGIGGFRLGMVANGFKPVYGSDNNKHAAKMYEVNFGENILNDIREVKAKAIPDFNVLVGGFPCQPFSSAGSRQGFQDATRGTLFFDLCRIIEEKKPEVVFLENVKNLSTHDKGNTLRVIVQSLNDLGYTVSYRVLNARDFGVPQSRERIIIIGARNSKKFDFDKVKKTTVTSMRKFLDKKPDYSLYLKPEEYTLLPKEQWKVQPSGLIFTGYRNKAIRSNGVREDTEHLSRAHKQPNRIYSVEGIHPTLSSQEPSGRYFVLDRGRVRRLSLEECYRLMGFPDSLKKVGSKSELYARIGNSICVPMVKAIAEEIKNQLF
jgi:DNA (cytosine-5)-methyltransferase 1